MIRTQSITLGWQPGCHPAGQLGRLQVSARGPAPLGELRSIPAAGTGEGIDLDERETPAHGLDDLSRAILEFEHRWWQCPGAKDQAIMETFGLSMTRYYQLLNGLLDDPAALAHDPVLVNRLRRMRGSRRPPR